MSHNGKFFLLCSVITYELELTPIDGKVSFFTFTVTPMADKVEQHTITNNGIPCLLLRNTNTTEDDNISNHVIIAKFGDVYNPQAKKFVPLMDALYDWECMAYQNS